MSQKKQYVPGKPFTVNDLIRYLIYLLVGGTAIFPGRFTGTLYLEFVLPHLPSVVHGVIVNFLFFAGTAVLLLGPQENKYIWKKIWRHMSISRYDIAPLSIGFVAGFLSVWPLS